MICGIIIDAGQILMLTFLSATPTSQEGGIIGVLTDAAKLGKFWQTWGSFWEYFWKAEFVRTLDVAATMWFGVIFEFIIVIVLAVMTILLFFRIIMLWILVAISPLVWGLRVLPFTQGYAKMWWTHFLKWVFFAPIMGFCIMLAVLVVTGGNLEASPADYDITNQVSGSVGDNEKLLDEQPGLSGKDRGVSIFSQGFSVTTILNFVFVCLLLWSGIMVAQSASLGAASGIVGAVTKHGFMPVNWAKREGGYYAGKAARGVGRGVAGVLGKAPGLGGLQKVARRSGALEREKDMARYKSYQALTGKMTAEEALEEMSSTSGIKASIAAASALKKGSFAKATIDQARQGYLALKSRGFVEEAKDLEASKPGILPTLEDRKGAISRAIKKKKINDWGVDEVGNREILGEMISGMSGNKLNDWFDDLTDENVKKTSIETLEKVAKEEKDEAKRLTYMDRLLALSGNPRRLSEADLGKVLRSNSKIATRIKDEGDNFNKVGARARPDTLSLTAVKELSDSAKMKMFEGAGGAENFALFEKAEKNDAFSTTFIDYLDDHPDVKQKYEDYKKNKQLGTATST